MSFISFTHQNATLLGVISLSNKKHLFSPHSYCTGSLIPVSYWLLSDLLCAFPSVDEHCCHHLTSVQHNSSENQPVNTCLDMDLGFKILKTATQLGSPVPFPVISIEVIHLSLQARQAPSPNSKAFCIHPTNIQAIAEISCLATFL